MPDLHCRATLVESDVRRWRSAGRLALTLGAVLAGLSGCASGPASLADDRLAYNEVVKVTAEQQMLLNIVRLRYTDTPSSLAISSIATQTERTRSLQLVPFFGVVGGEAQLRGGQALLPGAAISTVDRPTITLTPLDDTEFTRKLFTPMTLDGVLYLAKTTWPISTVFRLWLENLNWVSNAETASGPTSADVPEFGRFVEGVEALQALQDKGMIVFGTREREDVVGGPIAAARVAARDVVDAAREGLEYRPDPGGATWSLVRRRPQPVVRVHPNAAGTPEMKALAEAFRIRLGPRSYDIGFESLDPFPATYPAAGVDVFDLETSPCCRSCISGPGGSGAADPSGAGGCPHDGPSRRQPLRLDPGDPRPVPGPPVRGRAAARQRPCRHSLPGPLVLDRAQRPRQPVDLFAGAGTGSARTVRESGAGTDPDAAANRALTER